jgi:hypothetical protein
VVPQFSCSGLPSPRGQNILALAALGWPAENVLIEFNFNSNLISTVRRRVQRNIDVAGLLSFRREVRPHEN